MADYNRDRDYSHFAADDNWDKYDDRYQPGSNYRENRDDRGRGNVAYGGGTQNQYAQGNFDYGRPHDNRGREDWGYAYVNTGLNDDYNRSYYGHHRRHEDDDLVYRQREEERLRDYDRRAQYMMDRPGYREGDPAIYDPNLPHSSLGNPDDRTERRRMEGPHRGKGPKGYTRSVERIREDVCERLADDDKLDASNIQVRMEGNEVVLEGNVMTKHDKRRAEDLIENISGVANVQNHLVVGTPTTNAVISAVAEHNAPTYVNQIDIPANARDEK